MNELMQQVDWVILVAACSVFFAVTFAIWGVATAIAARRGHWTQRVKKLNSATFRNPKLGQAELLDKATAVKELLEKAAPALSKPLLPKSELEHSRLRLKLSAAGWRGEKAVHVYLTIKVLAACLGLLVGLLITSLVEEMRVRGWTVITITGGVGFYLPEVVVYFCRKRRQEELFCALPDALDLMVVCVEAGLTLDAAMRRVSKEMRKRAPVLATEFELANMQLQMGRPRREVLHELGVRNGVDDLRSLAAILIQADKFGSSIGQALRVQSDAMRTRRRQLAEEKAQKTAVKLLIPLILFIFPGVFIVLVGPAGIMIARSLGSAM